MSDDATIGSLAGLNQQRVKAKKASVLRSEAVRRPGIPFAAEVFQSVLMLERRRAERSRRPFALMLVDSHSQSGPDRGILERAVGFGIEHERIRFSWVVSRLRHAGCYLHGSE